MTQHIYFSMGWYFKEIHYGVARYAHEKNWRLSADTPMVSLPPDPNKYDGSICQYREGGHYDEILSSDKPKVELTLLKPELNLARVDLDNKAIGAMAAEYFMAKAYRSYCVVHYISGYHSDLRAEGFRETLNDHDFDCAEIFISAKGHDREQSLPHLLESLEKLPKPLALFATFDVNGDTCLKVCEEAGIRVPEEIAVLGAENNELICDWTPVPMSSINVDFHSLGYQSAKLLDQMMAGEPIPEQPILISPTKVVERQSSSGLAVQNPEVRQALYFMNESLDLIKGVDDIAREVACSRRKLENAFREHLNISINESLIRMRITACKKWLRESELTIKEIASKIGIKSEANLFRLFKARTGMTTKEYRRQVF